MSDETLEKLSEAIESVSFFKNRYWMETSTEIQSLRDEIEQLRNHLILWSNGTVRCVVCRMSTHGGERVPHEAGCIMAGYTKKSYDGPAVLFETTKESDASEDADDICDRLIKEELGERKSKPILRKHSKMDCTDPECPVHTNWLNERIQATVEQESDNG